MIFLIPIHCSSRRKEAPYWIAASRKKPLEPPYVGCYGSNRIGLAALRFNLFNVLTF
jgi:hypothetical protein